MSDEKSSYKKKLGKTFSSPFRAGLPFLLLLPLLVIVIFFAITNRNEVRFSEVKIKNRFSISIPNYLSSSDSIDASAILQYKSNAEKSGQVFLLVYEERKDSSAEKKSLQKYFRFASDNFVSKISSGNLIKYFPEIIHGSHAMIGNIRGRVNETEVYYRIAILDVNNFFYEIILGTTENYKLIYVEDMNAIIHSFKEIK